MDTRTVWEMVKDDYKEWFPRALRGFGAFNLNRKTNRGATGGLCRIVNFIIAIVGTPWILAHYIAFNNHNVRPQSRSNKIGYWIATIVALLFDAMFIGASVFIMWFVDTHPQGALLGFIDIVFFAIPLFWVGVKKIPYLFVRAPFDRKLNTASTKEFKPYWETSKPEPHIQYVKYNKGIYEVIPLTSTMNPDEPEDIKQAEEELVEELPFCQIFRLNETEDLHIVRVEYCPDETAFIRVVSEESYTKEYKRKVQIDEAGNRFIEFNDKKYYLKCSGDDEVIDIDKMDGATFEHFCADLLRVNGWTDVRITPASGDHGIDITAEKDDIKWGFQCKRWNGTKVDAVAIGQTYKGKALYECDMVAVITTSTLTAQAEGEAKQLGIKVWGRGKIRQLMSKLENAEDYYLSA